MGIWLVMLLLRNDEIIGDNGCFVLYVMCVNVVVKVVVVFFF